MKRPQTTKIRKKSSFFLFLSIDNGNFIIPHLSSISDTKYHLYCFVAIKEVSERLRYTYTPMIIDDSTTFKTVVGIISVVVVVDVVVPWMNQNWVQESILAWLLTHFHLVFWIRRDEIWTHNL